ncbi:MAG: ATP-binding protein, partial [Rhodospirillaceae bacterium]
TPKTGIRTITVHASPMVDTPGWVVVSLLEQTRALKIGQQLEHRNSARSVTAMAALLAHEVKNPLSGIRGAAQLLGQGAGEEDRKLTQLICDEADRIVALVNRMEVFSDDRPLERAPVNIHVVLERVRRLAENGFAKSVKFVERYDPSLPPVAGNMDQLVQVFLNLVKNAAEAVPEKGGEIQLSTAYQPGVRVAVQGGTERVQLPLVVTVQDNGSGIPEDLWPHLFDPFVTTKPKGSGLGLALVAKIISDHGGVIEFESQNARTAFRVMLPIMSDGVGA